MKVRISKRTVERLVVQERAYLVTDTELKGFGVVVHPSGAKTFIARYRKPGLPHPLKYTIGQFGVVTAEQAREAAEKVLSTAKLGGDPVQERAKDIAKAKARSVRTMNDLAEVYFASVAKRAATEALEQSKWRAHIQPRMGALQLSAVTRAEINDLLMTIGKQHTSAANHTYSVLRQMLALALDRQFIEANPIDGLKKPFKDQSRERVLSPDEIRIFWRALNDPAGPLERRTARALALAALTLQRAGEIAGMAVREIDLEAKTWTIPRERSKSKRTHVVPLSGAALEIIRDALREPNTETFVFPARRDASLPMDRHSITRAMARLTEWAGIEDVTPHDLRRTGATLLASERGGILSEVVGRVLNHAPGGPRVTLVYNRHDYMPQKREALDRLALVLQEIVSAKQHLHQGVLR